MSMIVRSVLAVRLLLAAALFIIQVDQVEAVLGQSDPSASIQPIRTWTRDEFYKWSGRAHPGPNEGLKSSHPKEALKEMVNFFHRKKRSIVFLAGDSSLDNKYWFWDGSWKGHSENEAIASKAVNGVEQIVTGGAFMDVAHQMNEYLVKSAGDEVQDKNKIPVVVNTSWEASTLSNRTGDQQGGAGAPNLNTYYSDRIIRDNLTKDDLIVVSVGGNDWAMGGTYSVAQKILAILKEKAAVLQAHAAGRCTNQSLCDALSQHAYALGMPEPEFQKNADAIVKNLLENDAAFMTNLKTHVVENMSKYLKLLTERANPRGIIMHVYYLFAREGESWANARFFEGTVKNRMDLVLAFLKLTANLMEQHLPQALNKPDIPVRVVRMYEFLDGREKPNVDFIKRCEPTPTGGWKIAQGLGPVVWEMSGVLSSEQIRAIEPTRMTPPAGAATENNDDDNFCKRNDITLSILIPLVVLMVALIGVLIVCLACNKRKDGRRDISRDESTSDSEFY